MSPTSGGMGWRSYAGIAYRTPYSVSRISYTLPAPAPSRAVPCSAGDAQLPPEVLGPRCVFLHTMTVEEVNKQALAPTN